ncbi:MAG: hypothetical protein GY756_01620 [bacterium]|nr:hypothetical protein [bacterium]
MIKEIIFFLYGIIGFFICFNFLINYKGALHELIAIIFFIVGAFFLCSMGLYRIITNKRKEKIEIKLEEHEIQDIRQIQIFDCVKELQKNQKTTLNELNKINNNLEKILNKNN